VAQRLDQRRIADELGVVRDIDVSGEVARRVQFLADAMDISGLSTLVLGVSGGVDSATAGALCRRAVDRQRELGESGATFIAMRLPYQVQADEADAQAVLDAVQSDEVLTVDVGPATDAALAEIERAGLDLSDAQCRDLVIGNIKARQRMIAQYAVAGARSGLVVGTDHAAEAVTGFFTKHGDGGVDIIPLAGLTKRQVRALAERLGVPAHTINKTPTADLHTIYPQRPDEDELGHTYEQIDDFLEGKPVSQEILDALVHRYAVTAHKRAVPLGPSDRLGPMK
jgi:NAD+ synthase